ncbi:MAG: cation:proton antiporter [Chlamydiae bacterium]|nr:cation:proton antiporter [Chlamydiota bacterium]MBI3266721.1 cation:proton antiporter [Chlamydiota bacterium]
MHGLLTNIGTALIAATLMGILAFRLRQPVILGYLIAGAFVGPEMGLKLVSDPLNIEIISEIGLILLLFIIGLELNLQKVIASGRQLLVVGIGQFLFCVILGLLIFPMLGLGLKGGNLDGLYLSLLCALSSTAIVVKLLYDKFELDTLSGRLTLGILVIQDLWAILILAVQPNFANPRWSLLALAILKSGGLLAAGFILSRFFLKPIYEWVAKSPEMVVATSMGWCALVSYGAGALGLSKEMGALIAGISISSFPYSIHVTAKTLPLRDFFLTLFFVSLGMKIVVPSMTMILASLGLVVFVVLSRFLTVYPLLMFSGGGRRTAFITSLNVSQVSEFSLVIALLGVGYGHLGEKLMAVMIYTMAFTAVISSYAIKFSHEIYQIFDFVIRKCGWVRKVDVQEKVEEEKHYPVVILGFHRGARSLIEMVQEKNPHLLSEMQVIDFNPEILKELKRMNIAALFGDISSLDTLKHAHLEHAQVILCTIPDMLLKGVNNLKLVKLCRSLAPRAILVATADSSVQAEKLKAAGASEVLLPYVMTGKFLSYFLEENLASSEKGK